MERGKEKIVEAMDVRWKEVPSNERQRRSLAQINLECAVLCCV